MEVRNRRHTLPHFWRCLLNKGPFTAEHNPPLLCQRPGRDVSFACSSNNPALNRSQGCAAAKSLAALAGKVRLVVAGKFPIIPKGYSGLVQQLLAVPSHWWNYGELWGIMGELWWNYGELW